jgi:alkylation response protein AidB-like acyl-CoA dehydrogenase
MNDTVPALATARSPALRQLYDVIAEGASARDADRIHPFEALSLLRGARFGALLLPAAEGGGGGSLRDVIEEAIYLAEADTNVAHIFRNHTTFVERFLVGSTGERRQGWRQTVLDGGIVGLATTELDRPQTGGAYPLKTTLTPDGDGFRLRGTKYYSTGSLYADLILVRATAPDTIGVTVVVPADRPGVELLDDWDGIGQRVTGTGTTNFQDVRVETGEVIVDRDNPPYLLPYISAIAQTFVTAVNAGIVRAVLRDAKALLHSRGRNFYYAPAETASHDPILQQTIGRIAADAFAAELVVLAAADKLTLAARARAAGEDVAELAHDAAVAAAKAKVIVDELALRSATALFDVGGASAATQRKNLDRHWNYTQLDERASWFYEAVGVTEGQVPGWEMNGSWYEPGMALSNGICPYVESSFPTLQERHLKRVGYASITRRLRHSFQDVRLAWQSASPIRAAGAAAHMPSVSPGVLVKSR